MTDIDKSKASEIYGVKGVKYKVDKRYYNDQWHEMVRLEGEVWVTKEKALEIAKKRHDETQTIEYKKRENEISVQSVINLKREIDKIQGDLAYMIDSVKGFIGDMSVFKKEMEGAFEALTHIKEL